MVIDKTRESEIIADMSRVTGMVYSDEQMKILTTSGGLCILAAAGSGKTSVLTHLIVKRARTFEIQDLNTLLCTTYSKGGADELEQRLNKLLKQFGITKHVTVKTMHALYLEVLREFDYPTTVIDNRERIKYITEACKDVEVSLDEDEFQSLDSLLSYQVNNLLSDAALVQSYAYNLDKVSLEQYSAIRKGYSNRKLKSHLIDFDDMQLYMYSLLYQSNRQDIIDYCHNHWTDIYVDEAQDMSRIQYAILRKIITDPSKLVIIGDDDQCIVPEFTMTMANGSHKDLEDVKVGDFVATCGPYGRSSAELQTIRTKPYDGEVISIMTQHGMAATVTPDHLMFVYNGRKNSHMSTYGLTIDNRLMLGRTLVGRGDAKQVYCEGAELNTEDYRKLDIKSSITEFKAYDSIGKQAFEEVFKDKKLIKKTDKCYAVTLKELNPFAHESVIKEVMYWYELLGGLGRNIHFERRARLCGMDFFCKEARYVKEDDMLPVIGFSGEFEVKPVVTIDRKHYTGTVYDFSVGPSCNYSIGNIFVHNCIYQWRGADPSIILNVCADYDIRKMVLSTNYRCAGNIVEKAAIGIKHNSRRSDKTMKPYRPGGDIRICDCGSTNLYKMSKYAYKHIKDLVINKGVKPAEIAVLSRNNAHICMLSNMLFKDGIYVEATNEMKMTKMPIYRALKDVMDLSMDTNSNLLVSSTLYRVCRYMRKVEAKRLATIMSDSGLNFSDFLGFLNKKYFHCAEVTWNKEIKLPAQMNMELSTVVNGLKLESVTDLIYLAQLYEKATDELRAAEMLKMFILTNSYQFEKKADKKRTFEGMVDYLRDLIMTTGYSNTRQFLKITEMYEDGRMAVIDNKICMSTMHGAKGKEWDHVVLFADDNVTFPSFDGIRSQINTGIAMSDIYYGIDENRRLHYVAMTRARKELAIFTDRSNIGLFILEAMGLFDNGPGNNSAIINMAQNGYVDKDLLSKSDNLIFGANSIYNYTIDISDLVANIEIDTGTNTNDTKNENTININDIKTGAAFTSTD